MDIRIGLIYNNYYYDSVYSAQRKRKVEVLSLGSALEPGKPRRAYVEPLRMFGGAPGWVDVSDLEELIPL